MTKFYFFTASWCPQCKMMKPTIYDLKSEGYDIEIVNAETEQDLVEEFEIQSLPVLVARGETFVEPLLGMKPESEIKKFLEKYK